MLGSWIPHSDYVSNLLRNLHWHCIYCSERVFQMEKSILKLFHLNLDKSLSILAPLYSHTGSPSREQAGIIRSFVLMLNQGYSSIPKWADKVANDRLLYDICGFSKKAPSTASYYDFIDRLWNGSKEPEIRRKKKFVYASRSLERSIRKEKSFLQNIKVLQKN